MVSGGHTRGWRGMEEAEENMPEGSLIGRHGQRPHGQNRQLQSLGLVDTMAWQSSGGPKSRCGQGGHIRTRSPNGGPYAWALATSHPSVASKWIRRTYLSGHRGHTQAGKEGHIVREVTGS